MGAVRLTLTPFCRWTGSTWTVGLVQLSHEEECILVFLALDGPQSTESVASLLWWLDQYTVFVRSPPHKPPKRRSSRTP